MITEFRGENYFLSNFYTTKVIVDGIMYANAEAAFQAAKSLDIKTRMQFCNLTGSEAKTLGHEIEIREDWDEVKIFGNVQSLTC